MHRLVVIFTVFLVSATVAWPSFSWMVSPLDVNPLVDWNGTECDGASTGARVCNYNCTKVLLCRGEADPVELATCEYPYGCLDGQCVNGSSDCQQSNQAVRCTGRGIFPDPYSCTKYHICKGANQDSIPEVCDHGWAFDPLTSVCSKLPTDSICTELPIQCEYLGDSKAFPGNPSIYYICVSDDAVSDPYPEVYRCPHGAIYNPSSFLCDDPKTALPTAPPNGTTSPSTATPTPSPSTATPTPSRGPTPPSTATPTTPNTPSTSEVPSPGGSCSTPLEKVVNPEDCYGYYQCSVVYLWTHMECDTGYYFNRDRLQCVYGTCPYSSSF